MIKSRDRTGRADFSTGEDGEVQRGNFVPGTRRHDLIVGRTDHATGPRYQLDDGCTFPSRPTDIAVPLTNRGKPCNHILPTSRVL